MPRKKKTPLDTLSEANNVDLLAECWDKIEQQQMVPMPDDVDRLIKQQRERYQQWKAKNAA